MATLSTRNLPIPPLTITANTNLSYQGNVSPNNIFSLDSFMNDRNMNPAVKKYEIYESPTDLLALSCAWKRMRDAGTAQGRISKLLDRDLFELLTSEDYSHAERVRDYYSKKIVIWKLKGDRMTSYRNDLSTFVHSDGTKFREDMLGLAYHLPSFYDYDTQMDDVRFQVEATGIPSKPLINSPKILKPLKRIAHKSKRVNFVQYWFRDTTNNHASLIQIDAKNQLEHLWNYVFDNSDSIEIVGNFHPKQRDNFEYLSISNWNLSHS